MLWFIISLVPSAHIFHVYWCQQGFLGSVISYNLDSCLANIAFPVWYSSWVFVMTVPLEGGLYSMWWIAWCDRDNTFRLWSCATLIDLQSVVIRLAMTLDSLLASHRFAPFVLYWKKRNAALQYVLIIPVVFAMFSTHWKQISAIQFYRKIIIFIYFMR